MTATRAPDNRPSEKPQQGGNPLQRAEARMNGGGVEADRWPRWAQIPGSTRPIPDERSQRRGGALWLRPTKRGCCRGHGSAADTGWSSVTLWGDSPAPLAAVLATATASDRTRHVWAPLWTRTL